MEMLNPDFTRSLGNAYFKLYDKFDIYLPIKEWQFLCEKRWFSDNPERETVEAEFGLYGARKAKTSEEAINCIKDCVTDLKEIMGSNITDQCSVLLDSDISTFLTMDSNGNLVVKDTNDEPA